MVTDDIVTTELAGSSYFIDTFREVVKLWQGIDLDYIYLLVEMEPGVHNDTEIHNHYLIASKKKTTL